MLSKLKSNMPPSTPSPFLLSANLRALRARAYDRHFWCRNYIKANKFNILLLQFYSGVARGIAKGARGEGVFSRYSICGQNFFRGVPKSRCEVCMAFSFSFTACCCLESSEVFRRFCLKFGQELWPNKSWICIQLRMICRCYIKPAPQQNDIT